MKNFVRNGDTMTYHVADNPVKSGDVVVVGKMIGVPYTDGEVGETVELATKGVYRLKKADGVAIGQGERCYAKVNADGTAEIVATQTGNIYAGKAWEDADAGDDTVEVNVND